MADEIQTLVEWGLRLSFSVDLARSLIRKTPELSALGVRRGPVRLYSAAEAEQIAAAVAARKAPAGQVRA